MMNKRRDNRDEKAHVLSFNLLALYNENQPRAVILWQYITYALNGLKNNTDDNFFK